MLEGKDYRNIDIVFSFVAGFIDNITGFQNNAPLTEITTLYSDIVLSLLYDRLGWTDTHLELDNRRQWPSSSQNSGIQFLLTGKDCPEQAFHNFFPVRAQGSPGFFLIATAQKETSHLKTPGSHLYVQHEEQVRRIISSRLVLTAQHPFILCFCGTPVLSTCRCWMERKLCTTVPYVLDS